MDTKIIILLAEHTMQLEKINNQLDEIQVTLICFILVWAIAYLVDEWFPKKSK